MASHGEDSKSLVPMNVEHGPQRSGTTANVRDQSARLHYVRQMTNSTEKTMESRPAGVEPPTASAQSGEAATGGESYAMEMWHKETPRQVNWNTGSCRTSS